MPSFPWPMRQDEPPMTDAALAALLAGERSPADAVAGLQPVADVLASLRAGPSSEELAGEASALTEFRRVTGVSVQTLRSHHRRPSVLTSLFRVKVAAAAAVALLGGLVTAAYADALPAPAQKLAHEAIGAPQSANSHSDASHGTAAVGPDATGKAAFGLCTAFSHAKAHGDASQQAVAFRNLAKAAGGASNIASFCAAVPHPGASSESQNPGAKPTSHPTGKPTALPTPHSHPTGKPTALPTPHPHPTH
jgi:hypothetical protein